MKENFKSEIILRTSCSMRFSPLCVCVCARARTRARVLMWQSMCHENYIIFLPLAMSAFSIHHLIAWTILT